MQLALELAREGVGDLLGLGLLAALVNALLALWRSRVVKVARTIALFAIVLLVAGAHLVTRMFEILRSGQVDKFSVDEIRA